MKWTAGHWYSGPGALAVDAGPVCSSPSQSPGCTPGYTPPTSQGPGSWDPGLVPSDAPGLTTNGQGGTMLPPLQTLSPPPPAALFQLSQVWSAAADLTHSSPPGLCSHQAGPAAYPPGQACLGFGEGYIPPPGSFQDHRESPALSLDPQVLLSPRWPLRPPHAGPHHSEVLCWCPSSHGPCRLASSTPHCQQCAVYR